MDVKPIKTESDYDQALKRINEIFDASPNTPDGDEAELLVTLVTDYEDEHYPINTFGSPKQEHS